MNARDLIIQIMPYGIYKFLRRRHYYNLFIEKYKEFLSTNNQDYSFNNLDNNTYDSIVSVQGLGFSGSGAVLDLLSEIDSCDVVGTIFESTNNEDHNGMFECDFLRLSGCLFEIEKHLNNSNIFHNDALLNRFVDYLNRFPLFRINNKIQNLFIKFFCNIVEFKILGINGFPFNYHLKGNKECSNIFYLKHLQIKEYRALCKSFLGCIFNSINTHNKKILVFDQLLADCEYDFDKYNDYIPNVKIVLVYRDPRDVYTFATQHVDDEGWLAHENVDEFISWYKIIIRNVEKNSNRMLVVQFESLVNNYESERLKILNYLDVDEKETVKRARSMFNPEISKKNVGLWKKSNLPASDFEKISLELKEFCYFG